MAFKSNKLFRFAALMLIAYEDGDYIRSLSKKFNGTYSFCQKIIRKLRIEGIITTKKPKYGKNTYIILTDKGKKLKKRLVDLKDTLRGGIYDTKL